MTMPDARSPHALRRPLVIAGLVLAVALVLTGTGFLTLQLQTRDFKFGSTVAAGSAVRVSASDLSVHLHPATDDRVHVQAAGSYRWSQPAVGVHTAPDGVVVNASCDAQGLQACNVSVDIDLPAGDAVSVTNTNGELSARSLTGRVSLTTTNGTIDASNLSGDVTMQTTDGGIVGSGMHCATVDARTSNARVSLGFVAPPDRIAARTTNGAITIQVPGTASYAVQPVTTNGSITVSVPKDDASGHIITATTSNGSVTVQPS